MQPVAPEQYADKSDPDSILYLHILIYLFSRDMPRVPCGSPPDTSLPNILGTAIVFRCIHDTTRAQNLSAYQGWLRSVMITSPGLFLGM